MKRNYKIFPRSQKFRDNWDKIRWEKKKVGEKKGNENNYVRKSCL